MPSSFATIGGIMASAVLLFGAAWALATGEIRFKGTVPRRDKQPVSFWTAWTLYAGLGLALLAYGFWGLLLRFVAR